MPPSLTNCICVTGRRYPLPASPPSRRPKPACLAAGNLGTVNTPEHCVVNGEMFRRTSAVDGKSYAIGFQMRMPKAWNGRYFYQGNGGIDGSVVTATSGSTPTPSSRVPAHVWYSATGNATR